ncbi:MAG: hypothetical protein KIB01_04475 [Negativicoccus succinicivorans]|uniref:Uncharacterized protein n=1 Tax=Negativicoccus succinicivorans DORA_17_25 TaxID=1403945 RepID=W1TZP5_9FIRM|nr:hypothetical protein [Negativicoccus succinicivorans]ETI86780.1 MAG: hypothetical protein Q612_NSC00277G0002 [Negativicoccus succinicivorans DORA_17_25]MBS5917601.1 hypothetical protein [Negativicoccus succinicivorans]MDU5395197.1 hypothetical protein [Negativicoccus succinicivorans]MDU5915120.1 hypothetical protein [Negativicoccus succinicivorans]
MAESGIGATLKSGARRISKWYYVAGATTCVVALCMLGKMPAESPLAVAPAASSGANVSDKGTNAISISHRGHARQPFGAMTIAGEIKQGQAEATDAAQEEIHPQAAVSAIPAIIWNGTMTEGATTLALLTINGTSVTLAPGESYDGYTVTGMTTRDLTLAGPQGDLHLQPLEAQ